MRRIDADALKKTMLNYINCENCTHNNTNFCADRCTAYDFLVMLEEAPTIEEKSYAMGYQDGAEDGLQGIRTPGKWVYRNDLISRDALREAFHKRIYYFDKSSWDEANAIINDAPTIFDPTVISCNTNALSNEEIEKLIKTIQSARIVPDYLQGWRYEETPYEIPTFNRKELEKARDYWYSHLEVGNEEQNEAAWAAINAIKYCIEHSSSYQEEGGAE